MSLVENFTFNDEIIQIIKFLDYEDANILTDSNKTVRNLDAASEILPFPSATQ